MKKEVKIAYDVFSSIEELSDDRQRILEKALEAVEKAYAPYSNFQVGAAVLLDDESVVVGNNQENIAYPSGLCAERVALFAANANFPDKKVTKLAIAARGNLLKKEDVLSPCGSCRQVMAEVSNRQQSNFEILLLNGDGSVMVFGKINDLLPFVFGNHQ